MQEEAPDHRFRDTVEKQPPQKQYSSLRNIMGVTSSRGVVVMKIEELKYLSRVCPSRYLGGG